LLHDLEFELFERGLRLVYGQPRLGVGRFRRPVPEGTVNTTPTEYEMKSVLPTELMSCP